MTKDETLRLALYTMEYTFACSKNQLTTKTKREYDQDLLMKAITAIKEALETKDEPVAWMYWQSCLNDDGTQTSPWVQRYSKFKPTESVINKDITPLYTATPQRTWVGLDTDEFKFIASKYLLNREVGLEYFQEEIEDKLKELNT